MSFWANHRDKNAPKNLLVFSDSFNRWSGAGNSEFRERVRRAYDKNQKIRLIISSTKELDALQKGGDASKFKKRFSIRPDLVGRVASVVGDDYTFEFVKDNL